MHGLSRGRQFPNGIREPCRQFLRHRPLLYRAGLVALAMPRAQRSRLPLWLAKWVALPLLLTFLVTFPLQHPSVFRNRDTKACVAAWQGDLPQLRRLVAKGADVNARRSRGFLKWDRSMTPLHFAADRGDTNMVQYLLEQGADPHLKTASGKTALDMAQSAAVKQLLTEALQKPTAPP